MTHLTLLGTSVATAPTPWVDAVAAGDGLRLLQALRQLTGAAPATSARPTSSSTCWPA